MGLFDFIRRVASRDTLDGAIARFYATRPSWKVYLTSEHGVDFLQRHMLGAHVAQTPPTEEEVLDFLHAHPHWKLVDETVLTELAHRISAPRFASVAYNYADGFHVFVLIAEKYRVVETNLLRICKEPDGPEFGTAEAKLWRLAWTLQQLATRLMREAETMSMSAERGNLPGISQRHADAMGAAEACLTADPWFYTAYTLLPILWVGDESAATFAYASSEHEVRRTHPYLSGDAFREAHLARFHEWLAARLQRAGAICDEGERLCKYLCAKGSSLPCFLDRKMAEEAVDGITQIRAVRDQLASM